MKGTSSPPRVLIVGEQTDLVKPLTELLQEAGYDCLLALGGDEALTALLTGRPDVAVIDLAAADGAIAVLRALHAADPELPAIVISRNGCSEEVRAAMIHGAFDYYTWPFDRSQLLTSIADAQCSRLEVSRV